MTIGLKRIRLMVKNISSGGKVKYSCPTRDLCRCAKHSDGRFRAMGGAAENMAAKEGRLVVEDGETFCQQVVQTC